MGQIGQPSQQQLAIAKVVEQQRDVIGRMLHPALAKQSDRLVEFALAAARNPAIAECTPESIVEALYTSAKVGLMPDGVEGAIVPRKEKGVPKAKFEPMYQGLVKAYLRGGKVTRVHADAILKDEKYEITSGSQPDIKHWPDITKDRSSWDNLLATYAVAFFASGPPVFIICPKAELERLRANAPQGGPWSNHPVAMAWKTPLKRLRKLVPLEPELQTMLQTQEYEEGALDIPGEVVAPQNLDQLLGTEKQAAAPAEPAEAVSAEPELWLYDIRIDSVDPSLKWFGENMGSKKPNLVGLTWEAIAASSSPHVVAEVESLLKDGARIQSEKGTAPVPFQRLAVAWNERRKRSERTDLKQQAEQLF